MKNAAKEAGPGEIYSSPQGGCNVAEPTDYFFNHWWWVSPTLPAAGLRSKTAGDGRPSPAVSRRIRAFS